jgi:ubiquinone biosynthesis protein UbiJ
MSIIHELLNQASSALLETDPDGKKDLQQLSGKVVCIELTAPMIVLYLEPGVGGIQINENSLTEPDVTLTGTLSAFVRLGTAGAKSGVLSSGQVSMRGDVDTGQAFQKALSRLDIDLEELLSGYIGDTPARKAGNLLRGFGKWATESMALSKENIADYLKEERRILPTVVAARRFESNVNNIRADVDRAEQRLGRVKKRIEKYLDTNDEETE